MRALEKGQGSLFRHSSSIVGKVHLVRRALGLT